MNTNKYEKAIKTLEGILEDIQSFELNEEFPYSKKNAKANIKAIKHAIQILWCYSWSR